MKLKIWLAVFLLLCLSVLWDVSANACPTLMQDVANSACRSSLLSDTYTFSEFTTNATTTLKTGAGFLHAIVPGKGGSAWVIDCWNNTAASGAKILSMTIPAVVVSVAYDVAFTIGLTCTTSGTTPGDLTVSYR
jgi:hypothetical protein